MSGNNKRKAGRNPGFFYCSLRFGEQVFYTAVRYFINRHKDVVGAGDFVVDIGVFCDIMIKSNTLKANSTVKVACRERPVGERATRTCGNTCRSRPLNKQ